MSLTPDEAADALRNIETAGRRSGEAFGYRISAPFFIIWGVCWIVGYGGTDLFPHWAGIIWPASAIAATLACFLVGRFGARGHSVNSWRFGGIVLALWLFLFATYAVLGPITPRQQGAFVPLVIATLYGGMGLWIGVRYVIAGVSVAVLTLFGFYQVHEHFNLYMAAVGGGGLVLVGLWLRSA